MTTKRQDTPFPNLCQFVFSDDRQCSMPAAVGNYCRSHAAIYKRRPPVEEDLSSEFAQYFSEKDGSLDVHRALERVFKALSANRITTRRAATFGYLGQLILLSKPGFDSQASLSKTDLHDLTTITCDLLSTAYGPGPKSRPRRSPSSEPASTHQPSNLGSPQRPSSAEASAQPEPKQRAS